MFFIPIRADSPFSLFAKWLLAACFNFPLMVQAQPCSTTQFSKVYTFEGSGAGHFFDRINGTSNFYFGGIRDYSMVMSTADNNGNLLWSKQYKFDQARFYSLTDNVTIDSAGNYFINIDANCIGLLDGNGNPKIAREMEVPSQNVYGVGMGILPDNKKIILLNDQSSYGRGYMLLCLSEDLSAIVWNKHFSGGEMYFGNPTIYDNKIFVPGSWQNKGTLLCFDGATGNLLVKKTFTVDNKQTSLEQVHPYNDGYIVQAKYYRGETNHHLIFRLDKNFEVLNLYRFLNIPNDGSIILAVEPGGSFHGAWSNGSFGHSRFFMSTRDSILWNHANFPYGLTGPRKLLNTNEGLVLFSSGSWYNVGQGNYSAVALSRSDGNGRFANCPPYQQTFQKTPMSYTSGVSTIEARDTSILTLLPGSITTTDNNTELTQNCLATSNCDALKLYGNTFTCNNATAVFVAKRNAGCFTPVNWSLTGGKCSYQQLNDSTLSVQFLQPGNYTLRASLKTCQNIGDTIQIQVGLASQLLDLGPDTTICPGNSILLNAKVGYASYRWQDGSTDYTYPVNQPGSYKVTVTDVCGNVGQDSISVSPHPYIPLSIGPDRIKCNGDTIHIIAPAGFLNYRWSPDYQINSLTSQNVVANPLTDTFYVVRAEKLPGCFASDTVHVTVNTSPSIELGPDLSLCDGDNITFSVEGNFSSYQWNIGNNSNYITVNQPGQYSVTATTDQGCSSYDSVAVLNIFSNPLVNLGYNNKLCSGSIMTLDAGNFSTYLWSNGSTERTLPVKDTGIYSVTVTDNNGCIGHSIAKIDTLLDSPFDFLPADTTICSYETIQIKSQKSYQSYLWSNNSSFEAITISQAGTYYLTVTDQNNCSGRDTINVRQKDCMKGCYVPGAFTPNADGKNDRLRPLLFGNVVHYRFTVFNRSGRIVFQTTDLMGAWDGSYAGSQETSNAYVWTCNYQFQGEKEQFATGSVILIR